jgi:hypothetical protein
MVTTLTKEQID